MISAWVTGRLSSNWVIGNRNASVFPEPVSASKITALEVLLASKDACCISFNSSICKFESVFSIENIVSAIRRKYVNFKGFAGESLLQIQQYPIAQTEIKLFNRYHRGSVV